MPCQRDDVGGQEDLIISHPKRISLRAVSYEEAAWSLGISRSKLYRLVSEGRLPCVIIDGNTVLRTVDLEKFVEKNTTTKSSR
jgi:excisionase family DNA binding protein